METSGKIYENGDAYLRAVEQSNFKWEVAFANDPWLKAIDEAYTNIVRVNIQSHTPRLKRPEPPQHKFERVKTTTNVSMKQRDGNMQNLKQENGVNSQEGSQTMDMDSSAMEIEDQMDTSDNSSYEEDSDDVICTICHTKQGTYGANESTEFVQCNDCQKIYHLTCLPPPVPTLSEVSSSPWYCRTCRNDTANKNGSVNSAGARQPEMLIKSEISTNSYASISSYLMNDIEEIDQALIHACHCSETMECNALTNGPSCANIKRLLRTLCWASHNSDALNTDVMIAAANAFAYHSIKCKTRPCFVPMCEQLNAYTGGYNLLVKKVISRLYFLALQMKESKDDMNDSDSGCGRLEDSLQILCIVINTQSALDSLVQAFQVVDVRQRKRISDFNQVIYILKDFIPPRCFRNLDLNALLDAYTVTSTKKKQAVFKYMKLCDDLQMRMESQLTINAADMDKNTANEFPISIRVDKRLEHQRLLVKDIQKKFLAGLHDSHTPGFAGIQHVVEDIIQANGWIQVKKLQECVFNKLKIPLSPDEVKFVLARLASNLQERKGNWINFYQLQTFFHLDSEIESLSEAYTENSSALQDSIKETEELGTTFLTAEKDLQQFLDNPQIFHESRTKQNVSVLGAERFLQFAHEVDLKDSGVLEENDFYHILQLCGVDMSPQILRSILARLEWMNNKISYHAFLARFGHFPGLRLAKRRLNEWIYEVIKPNPMSEVMRWIERMHHQCSREDTRLHKQKKGYLPSEVFVKIICQKPRILRISSDSAKLAMRYAYHMQQEQSSKSNDLTRNVDYTKFLSHIVEVVQINVPVVESSQTIDVKESASSQNLSSESPQQSVDIPLSQETISTPLLSVGKYLMHHATDQERKNFEDLMDCLNNFHQQCQKMISVPEQENQDIGTTPIVNGIAMKLGVKLKVQIQFSID